MGCLTHHVDSIIISSPITHFILLLLSPPSLRLFGWSPFALYLLYRFPLHFSAIYAVYYWILSPTDVWRKTVRGFCQYGMDPRFHLFKSCDIDFHNKRYLVSVHPHGIYCEGVLYSIVFDRDRFHAAYPGINYKGAGASQVRFLPLFREMLDGHKSGLIGVSKREMLSAFRADPTVTIGMCPGGFSEAVFSDASNTVEYAYLKGRKGFIKLAIEAGVELVFIDILFYCCSALLCLSSHCLLVDFAHSHVSPLVPLPILTLDLVRARQD